MSFKAVEGHWRCLMTEDQKKYYNAMKKLGSKQPQKPIPKPKVVSIKSQSIKSKLILFRTCNMMQ